MSKHIPRIYIKDLNPNTVNEIPQFHAKHLSSVLRIKQGDSILAFSEDVGEWKSEIVSDKQGYATGIQCLEKIRHRDIENRICLAFGIIKKDNMMWMIEKTVELGVTNFYPLITEYTNLSSINLGKCEKIIISAVEQSERINIPKMHNPLKLHDFLNKEVGNDLKWFSAIERKDTNNNTNMLGNVGFIVGPEGGFSTKEKGKLEKETISISISKNILRAETAAIACIAIKSFSDAN